MVGALHTANNTRLPGGQSAAPNCRFEASVAVPLEDSLAASCQLCCLIPPKVTVESHEKDRLVLLKKTGKSR
jgi:hypothetical protein